MRTRYPGTVPFSTAQADLFFGREAEIQDLQRLIDLRRMVVLHGRSGLGKSSLLGAGLIPRLQDQGSICIRIRLGSHQGPDSPSPTATLAKALQDAARSSSLSVPIDSDVPSLWQLGKYIQHERLQAGIEQPRILLIFDQFEELFSYPDRGQRFARSLAELLSDQMPRSFRRGLDNALEEGGKWPNDEELAFWERPLGIKALVAIRSDKMSLLDQLSEALPYVLNHRYELQPLQADGAGLAIATPAGLEGEFSVSPFQYQDATLAAMLADLQDETGSVEPFQLQILCQHVEQRLREQPDLLTKEADELPSFPPPALPDTAQLFRDYYETALRQIEPEADRQQAQKLIENGLVLADEERRLTLDQAQIQHSYQVAPALLQRLVDIRLLRAEPNRMGGLSYELSHDTLIPSILNTREEREARERIEREKEAAKAQLQTRIRQVLLAAGLLLLLTGGVLSYLLWSKNLELQAVSNQILRAYSELGAFINLDEDDPATQEADLLDKARDLTTELTRTKQTLQARVEIFKTETEKLKEQLNNDQLSPTDLKQLVETYQQKVDSLVVENEVIEVTSKEEELKRLMDLPGEDQQAEIDARLGEAQRLEQRGLRPRAMLAYQDILLLDSANAEAKAGIARLTPVSVDATEPGPNEGATKPAAIASLMEQAQQAQAASDWEQSLSLYREILRLDPDNQQAQDRLAEIQAAQQARADSLAQQTQRLAQALSQANGYANEASWEAALSAYQRALSIEPGNAQATAGQQRAQDSLDAQVARLTAAQEPTHEPPTDQLPLPRMIRISGGTFQMGSEDGTDDDDEQPVHSVTVSTFYLAETEVTFAQYDYFCEATSREKPEDLGWGRGDRPVIKVSWNDAQAYIQWLNQQPGQSGWRLPTEAEWEYAAGGGASGRTTYAGTNSKGSLGTYAVYGQLYSTGKTSSVESKQPNRLGLYDMSGNVWEWCQDWYGDYPSSPQINPTGSVEGSYRVYRGGSWGSDAGFCHVAGRNRNRVGPDDRYSYFGFRVARQF